MIGLKEPAKARAGSNLILFGMTVLLKIIQ